jgi:hypothetical protein
MIKNVVIILIVVLLSGCKSTSEIYGEYYTDSSDSLHFNFKNHTYFKKLRNGKASGKFKTLILSKEKVLVVCNDMVLGRTSGTIKELANSGDSIPVGVWDGFKKLGSTVFEITISKDSSLTYRKTYTNELTQTLSEGKLIRPSANTR